MFATMAFSYSTFANCLHLMTLGEGSYGSVFKALHKESGQVLAIKQVPVESDLGMIAFSLLIAWLV